MEELWIYDVSGYSQSAQGAAQQMLADRAVLEEFLDAEAAELFGDEDDDSAWEDVDEPEDDAPSGRRSFSGASLLTLFCDNSKTCHKQRTLRRQGAKQLEMFTEKTRFCEKPN